ncbi:MAG: histidine kinase, partial [Bacteroidia bacterium]|nr:histidine kinase [Bacteroidia bacterium]
QRNLEEATNKFLEALKIEEAIGDRSGMAESLYYLGEVYLEQKKLAEAEKYCEKSLVISKEINSLDGKKNCFETLSEIYGKTGRFEKALNYHKLFIAARDSLINEENTKKAVKLEMNYEFEKKELKTKSEQEKKDALFAEQNRVKELQLSRSRYFTYGLSGVVLLMIIIGVLFFRQSKIRSQQRAMQLEQKLLRTQMNPHFIFNSLNSIHSVVLNGETRVAAKYLSSFAKLIRSILESSRFEIIPLEKEIALLENYISLQMLRFDNEVHYKIFVDPKLDVHNTMLPPMLTQPFIENALEHGLYSIKDKPELNISFTIEEDLLHVEVWDNGHGINETANNSEHISLATVITIDRLKLLNRNKRKKTSFTIGDAFPQNNERKGVKVSFFIPLALN